MTTPESDGSAHLFVWAWDVDGASDDFLAVIDVDRRSPSYGQVVTTPWRRADAARTTWSTMSTGQPPTRSRRGAASSSISPTPRTPRCSRTSPTRAPSRNLHSFARTPSGTVLGTFQGRADDHDAVGVARW
ncbi:MAG: hypothetical protein R2909_00270 [Gemmatimonadales bacterium]